MLLGFSPEVPGSTEVEEQEMIPTISHLVTQSAINKVITLFVCLSVICIHSYQYV